MTTGESHFEEEQSFVAVWMFLPLGILVFEFVIFAGVAVHEPHKAGGLVVPGIIASVACVGLTVLLRMIRLVVTIDSEFIRVRFIKPNHPIQACLNAWTYQRK